MKLSIKFKPLILTVAFFVPFISPVWAACVTQATRVSTTVTGEEYYSFDATCPTGYRDSFDLKVWKDVTILFYEIDNGTVGVGGAVHAVWGPFGPGNYEAKIYCFGPGVVDICNPANFTITVPSGETCTDDCGGPGDCAAGETCDKSCDPNGVVGNCVGGPPPPPPGPSPCSGSEIPTGLGCIPTDPADLILRILEIAIGTAGGIALLSVVFGGFKVLTSSGNPDAISEGKGMITSAIAGLALILFSVAILNIIGFDILGIPFFNVNP